MELKEFVEWYKGAYEHDELFNTKLLLIYSGFLSGLAFHFGGECGVKLNDCGETLRDIVNLIETMQEKANK